MSIFPGKLDEIPEVSIDRFDGEKNLSSTAYFLSHCHSDHMKGLGMEAFRKALFERDGVYLYASEISCCILKSHGNYRHLNAKIRPLSSVGSKILTIPSLTDPTSSINLQVTLIPAGHCPGSVMFLFELRQGNILYTGDFRLTLNDVCSLAELHHKEGTPKDINTLYLDATFFDDLHPIFPRREESFRELYCLTKEWLDKSHYNEVLIDVPAQYGAEFIYCELKKQLGLKVHVSQAKCATFKGVKEISDAIIEDGQQTRIHACVFRVANQKRLPSECNRPGVNLLTIRVSCMWYERSYADRGIISEELFEYIRVCYACHCSKKELVDFVEYFLPKKVVVCAVPPDRTHKEVEMEIMDHIQSYKRNRGCSDSSDTPQDHKISYSKKCQVKRKIMTSPRKRRPFPQLSPEMSEDEVSSRCHSQQNKNLKVPCQRDDSALHKSFISESHSGDQCSASLGLSIPGEPLRKQGQSTELPEVSGSSCELELESSPSLLPQLSKRIIDPTTHDNRSPDCCIVNGSQEETEIEVVTLSSDESPEIFVIE